MVFPIRRWQVRKLQVITIFPQIQGNNNRSWKEVLNRRGTYSQIYGKDNDKKDYHDKLFYD